MLKRGLVLALVLTGLLIVAWSPIGAEGLPASVALQATYPPPGLPTIAITIVAPTVLAPGAPASPGTGMPSTLVIGLLIIILIAVIVGGMALLGRRQS